MPIFQLTPEFEDGDKTTIVAKEGDEIPLKVTIRGKPTPDVKWYYNGLLVRDTSRVDLKAHGNKHTLTLLSFRHNEAGTYKCEATSRLGSKTKIFVVELDGKVSRFCITRFRRNR